MSDLRAILLSTWVLAVLGSVMAGIRDSCSGYAGFWPWLLYVGLLSVSLSLSLSLSLSFSVSCSFSPTVHEPFFDSSI